MPNVRTHPTPAIPQPRGVGDAAPYGRQRNVGCDIVVSRCADAANLHPPLGSPERGAVAARSAVTEGLRPTSVRRTNVAGQPGAGRAWKPAPTVCGRWAHGIPRSPMSNAETDVARETGVDGRPTDGAPGTVRPTTCGECFRIANTSSVIRRKGRRGRRPLRGVRVGMFLRSREVGGLSGYSFHARCVIFRKAGFAAACRVHRPRCTVVT